MNKTSYWKLYVFVLFVIVGVIIYWNCLSNPFFYDDELYVVKNLNIRTLDNIPLFFKKASALTSKGYPTGHYRPLVIISYALNYAIGGLNTFSYHLFNLTFHIGSAFLVFLIVKAMLDSIPAHQGGGDKGADVWLTPAYLAPLAAGILFLVHPFNSETVNYITARSSVMSGFFYLLAFWCWIKYREQKALLTPPLPLPSQGGGNNGGGIYFYTASLLAFIAGMLSKEVVVTLPIVLWLYDIYFKNGTKTTPTPSASLRAGLTLPLDGGGEQGGRMFPRIMRGWQEGGMFHWRSYIAYVPFVLVVAVPYFLMRIFYFGSIVPHFQRDISTQIFTVIPVLIKHWQMFLFPYPLTPLHDVLIQNSFFSFHVIVSILITIVWVIAAIVLLFVSEKHPPMPPLVKGGITAGLSEPDKLPPLRSGGGVVGHSEPEGLPPLTKGGDGGVGFIPICEHLFSLGTSKLISFFMLWFLVVLLPTTIFPLNFIFQENRGYLAIVSFVVMAGLLLGTISRKGYKKAGVFLLVLITIIYSVVVFQRNRVWKDELSLWGDVVQKEPEFAVAWTALGVAYRRAGMYNQAISASQKAIEIGGWQNFVVHDNLARTYMALGKWDLTAIEFEKAVKIVPAIANIHNDLGIAYFKMGKYDLAEREYREAVRLDPGDYSPYFNIGVLYGNKGRSEDAISVYKKALSVFPGHLRSNLHIGIELEELGRGKESVTYYRYVVSHAVNENDKVLADEAMRRLNEMKGKGVRIDE